jgi:antitoxin ParD1/3/4
MNGISPEERVWAFGGGSEIDKHDRGNDFDFMSHTELTVNLTPELKALVEAKVQTGWYEDASEVIREALRAWEEGSERAESQELEALVEEGLRSGPPIRATAEAWKAIQTRGRRLAQQLSTKRDKSA